MSYCLIKDKNNPADHNGHGSVPYNFLIQQNFISCEDYTNFLNSIGNCYKSYNLYNSKIENIIQKKRSIFYLKKDIDPSSPISYIGLSQLKIYCNWLNTSNLLYLYDFPYNLKEDIDNSKQANIWIPSYDEWYKAAYYDPVQEKYWSFPNRSDSYDNPISLSAYGLINAGFQYYTILNNNHKNQNLEYIIAGGSKNRHPINAKSGTFYNVSNTYYASYISGRLCKKSESKKFILKLYDIYGDGWGPNYIDINNASHKPLYTNISLKNGYGPYSIIIEVDKAERNINIRYHKKDSLAYENYYEFYDFDTQNMIYASSMYNAPDSNIIIGLI